MTDKDNKGGSKETIIIPPKPPRIDTGINRAGFVIDRSDSSSGNEESGSSSGPVITTSSGGPGITSDDS